jgi:hypothetical protein
VPPYSKNIGWSLLSIYRSPLRTLDVAIGLLVWVLLGLDHQVCGWVSGTGHIGSHVISGPDCFVLWVGSRFGLFGHCLRFFGV